MFNPFSEVAEDDAADLNLVKPAIGSDRAALEILSGACRPKGRTPMFTVCATHAAP
jgi:hypothetical protein